MISRLVSLVGTPSVSRDESLTADLIQCWIEETGCKAFRSHNNVWAFSKTFDPGKPTLLLNSHHDTVKPTDSWTKNPFLGEVINEKIYGLGSNDAGASVVCLLELFGLLCDKELNFNVVIAITAEEEVGGDHGVRDFLKKMNESGIDISMAIVGEPTGMRPAIAERGLVVLDCVSHGVAGHAARGEGVNALYKAIEAINKIRVFDFGAVSKVLGETKANVTQIEAGTQHNVIPDLCRFVVDIRTTDALSNEEVVEKISQAVECEVVARSTRVRASVIEETHPLVRAATGLGLTPFVSPTTSDMSLMYDFPSLKIGPGESARSHKADEFVEIKELEDGLALYMALIMKLNEIVKDGQ